MGVSTRFITFSVLSILTLFIWVSSAQSNEYIILPKFSDISDQITLRYHPIPESKFTASVDFHAGLNGKRYSGSASILGNIRIKKNGGHLVWTFFINDLKIVSKDVSAENIQTITKFLPFIFSQWIDRRGNLQKVVFDKKNSFLRLIDEKQKEKFETELAKQIADGKSHYPPVFPIGAVQQGGILYSIVDTIPTEGMGLNLKLKEVATVKGQMSQLGRRALLVETRMRISEGVLPVKLKGNGYIVIDTQTGIPAYTKARYKIDGHFKGEDISLDLVWDLKISLPTTFQQEELSVSNNLSIKPTVKDRLITLKKLLDTGLITKEEAAAKRKKILDGI